MPKNGRVKLSRTFPTPGQFVMRSIAVRAGKGRPVKGRPFIITAVAKRYQGSFGGEHTSGTSWNGSLTYFYQQRDPVTNQPWSDGDVHYVGVEGSVTWRFDASALNADTGVIGRARRNCAADPRTGQIPLDSLDATMTVAREVERAKGRRYRVSVFVQEAPRIQYTCEYLDLDDDLNEIWVPETRELSLQFGPNVGDLLTNALSVTATGEAGQYTKSLDAPVVGDINRPGEAVTNHWFWNLSAS